MNPLLFCPSPRSIPEVLDSWKKIPYDKYIIKNKLEHIAYPEARTYFLENKQYSHIVICPDDLVIDYDSFHILKKDVMENKLSNLAGIANIDESQPDVYCCKAVGTPLDQHGKGSYYDKDTIPDSIFEAGFTGFACQWIDRNTMEKLSFTGGCNGGMGCMDVKFTEELLENNIKQLVQPKAFFYHMRMEQYHEVIAWKNRAHTPDEGHSFLLKKEKNIILNYDI